MALATLVAAFLGGGPQAPLPPVGAHGLIAMPINKILDPVWEAGRKATGGTWVHPMSSTSIHVGRIAWSVENSKLAGKACKLFKGDSRWQSKVYVGGKPTRMVASMTLYLFAWVDPSGTLLKSQTSLAGLGEPTQIEATYGDETIDVTTTKGRDVRRSTLYPKMPMEAFRNVFTPLVVNGLPVQQEKECAMLHPVSGAPYSFKLKIAGRFQAKMVEVKYEGYYVDVVGDQGRSTAGITRQGQLLSIQTPDSHEALAYSSFTRDELEKWGPFKAADWDVPASVAHPGRRRHQTLIAPVFLRDPRILVPVPCALAL